MMTVMKIGTEVKPAERFADMGEHGKVMNRLRALKAEDTFLTSFVRRESGAPHGKRGEYGRKR